VVRLARDHRPERVDEKAGLDFGPHEHEAADNDAMTGDGHLKRMAVIREARPHHVDRQTGQASQARPSAPVRGHVRPLPFDVQERRPLQILRGGQAEARTAQDAELLGQERLGDQSGEGS